MSRSSLVFCGPSGVGKSTILRKPREGEQDGREYHFVTHDQFEWMIDGDKFIEHTKFASNFYGTSKQAIEDVQKEGKCCVLDLDWQGVLSVRRLNLDAKVIFLRPPSMSALRDRLNARGTESTESLDARLKAAEEDMLQQEQSEHLCDLVLVNDDIDVACKQVEEFIFQSTF